LETTKSSEDKENLAYNDYNHINGINGDNSVSIQNNPLAREERIKEQFERNLLDFNFNTSNNHRKSSQLHQPKLGQSAHNSSQLVDLNTSYLNSTYAKLLDDETSLFNVDNIQLNSLNMLSQDFPVLTTGTTLNENLADRNGGTVNEA
jgi:hypothetical protein